MREKVTGEDKVRASAISEDGNDVGEKTPERLDVLQETLSKKKIITKRANKHSRIIKLISEIKSPKS